MSQLIALFYYFIFVSVISAGITNEGFLLLGGSDGNNSLPLIVDNVEAYGSNLSLPSLPSLPFPLEAPIAEMTESGAIYVAGGKTSDRSRNSKTLMLSSLNSSAWEEVERMPIPVWEAASVIVGDIVIVLGGSSDSDSDSDARDVIQMLNTNKSLSTWTILNQSLPVSLRGHSAAVFEGQVIIVTYEEVTFTTSVFSIINDTELDWVKGELPGAGGTAYIPSIEFCEDKLVAVHGREVFTKTSMGSQWIQLEDLPEMKYVYPSIGLVRENIVIGGGFDSYNSSATVFMWLEASSEWEEVTSLKIPRKYHATVQLRRGTTITTQDPKPTTSTNRIPSPNN